MQTSNVVLVCFGGLGGGIHSVLETWVGFVNMVTEEKIEEILCISSVSYSQIISQLPFKGADINPVAVCPKCYEGDWGRGVESRMGKYEDLRKA